jgi:hypothetical protein
MGLDFLVPIFGILIVLVPVIGLTTVLTLRLGLKPFLESLAKELRGTSLDPNASTNVQLADLSEQIELLAGEVRRLKETQEFDNRLLKGEEAERGLPGS